MASPKISIAIPYHQGPNTAFYLSRLLNSIYQQSFKDYEIVLTDEGPFAKNHNAAISKSKGELIKLMQVDDFFAHPFALQYIVGNFKKDDMWGNTACLHTENGIETFSPHMPEWSDDIFTGNNTLGSVSTLVMRNEGRLLFEEPLTWVVDCDLYYRLFLKYGKPTLLKDFSVVITVRNDSLTNTLTDVLKLSEIQYLNKKYA